LVLMSRLLADGREEWTRSHQLVQPAHGLNRLDIPQGSIRCRSWRLAGRGENDVSVFTVRLVAEIEPIVRRMTDFRHLLVRLLFVFFFFVVVVSIVLV
jgi:hypothetical protein